MGKNNAINHPFVNGYQLFMVIWGLVYYFFPQNYSPKISNFHNCSFQTLGNPPTYRPHGSRPPETRPSLRFPPPCRFQKNLHKQETCKTNIITPQFAPIWIYDFKSGSETIIDIHSKQVFSMWISSLLRGCLCFRTKWCHVRTNFG